MISLIRSRHHKQTPNTFLLHLLPIFLSLSTNLHMAEQIVSSVVSRACDFVFDKICDLLRYEYGLLGGLTDDVQKLNKLMDDFRKIAEEKGGKIFKSDTTKDWLFDVNRAVEEAERIVEEAQNLPPSNSFVVSGEEGQRITELKLLNGLEGELLIKGLENVRDATEATEAMLKEKNNLSSLFLIWGSSQGSDSSNDEAESPQSSDEAGAVLEALEPPESLNEKLVIDGYGGSVFPRWMQLLHNLVEIELRDCYRCERLPPLGQLVHLRELTITRMRSLKRIGTEFYGSNSSSGGGTIFPSLVELVIEDMPKLEEWQEVHLKGNQKACPCLRKVKIKRCESLQYLPECLRNLSNLWMLDISKCDQMELSSEDLQSLSAEWMDLDDLPKLTSFPALQHFSKLQRLSIRGCKNLISLGPQSMMQNPTVLYHLFLDDCEQLELSSTDFQHLLKLREIRLQSLPKLTSLPQLQHLPFLEELQISRCKNLKVLPQWLQNITSLGALWIDGSKITMC